MHELSGHSTFLIGLRVDEDGELRFAIGDRVIEMSLTQDDDPVALREVAIAELDEVELVPWKASRPK